MATDWPLRPLGELTENLDSIRVPVKEADRRTGSYPYYGASGIVDYVDGYLFDGEYLLIAEDGENLRTRTTPIAFLARGKFWVNNHAHIVRGNSEADTRFLMYALADTDIGGYLTGSTMPKLTQGNMNRIPVPAPAPDLQRAVADILGALDDKIELNRQMNETLETIARALFVSWFVNFDPVHAKVAGHNSPLSKTLAGIVPHSFTDLELGLAPSGWSVGSILDCARLLSGGTPKTDRQEYWSGNIPWASAKDVSQCGDAFLIDTERNITERGLAESATQIIPAFSTVVVARGATTGRMALFGRDMAMNQTCYALASKLSTPFTLYCQLRHEMEKVVHTAHGSVFDTITTNTLENSRIFLPPGLLLESFETRIGPLFHRILTNIEESRALTGLRNTLLPKLISGELRIKDTKKIVGERV